MTKLPTRLDVLLLWLLTAGVAGSSPGTITIMDWPEGKTAAYAITFDDGYRNNYQLAAPILEKHGLRGTFYLNGGWMDAGWTMSWADAGDLIARGHEIGNHSLTHPSLNSLPIGDENTEATGIYQIVESWKRIQTNAVEGSTQSGMSFAFPYGNPNIDALTQVVMDHHVSARNSSGHINFPDLASLSSLRSEVPKFPEPRSLDTDLKTMERIQSDISARVLGNNRFGILLLHNVQADYDDIGGLTISETVLDTFLQWLAQRAEEDQLWVDTVYNISRYIRERESISCLVQYDEDQVMRITPEDGLDDAVYNYPLAARIAVPESWQGTATVRQAGQTRILPITPGEEEGYIMTTLDPAGGLLAITGQTGESWAGYPVSSDGIVDTGPFLGYLEVSRKPWIWSYSLDGWAYIDQDNMKANGAWIYLP